ncbi:alpha/beta fold hydrolase [Streptomyces sp. NPDC097704]|uniref:alpha/beta hydrolase n=1 Tax=Streptomyces sp. NPDC097704 TaxID=3157101 RepID=UPI003330593C
MVLVHGAFTDASGWREVSDRLQRQGYDVVAPANPLRGLSNDSTYVVGILKSIKSPLILVGHSSGGAGISSAASGNPNVKALAYVAAFMPDEGESPAELSVKFPGSELGTALRPVPYEDNAGSGTDVYIQNGRFHDVFAADLPESQTRFMAIAQRPISAAASPRRPGRPPGRPFPPGSWSPVRTRPSPRTWNGSRPSGQARALWRSTPRTWR